MVPNMNKNPGPFRDVPYMGVIYLIAEMVEKAWDE
jgi:hypothetical protein